MFDMYTCRMTERYRHVPSRKFGFTCESDSHLGCSGTTKPHLFHVVSMVLRTVVISQITEPPSNGGGRIINLCGELCSQFAQRVSHFSCVSCHVNMDMSFTISRDSQSRSAFILDN